MAAKETTALTNLIVTVLVPLIIFVASAGILYSKVDDIGDTQKDHTETLNDMKHRITKVETKVEFLYDERKASK